jgi:aspartate-semialdehyde dehydrogenase
MSAKLKVAVVGATGAVGRVLLSILKERRFPVAELIPFASARSEGQAIEFDGKTYPCRTLKKGCFEGVDIAFFDASDAISKEWALHAAEAGAWVVDNSATFRMAEDVFLLVPEVNGDLLRDRLAQAKKSGEPLSARERLIAGPNCTTAQLVVALHPIHERWGIQRVLVSTYQSASGAGSAAMDELSQQTSAVLQGKETTPQAFAHRIAFNCIPHIGGFKDDDFTSEEIKIIEESRKILRHPRLRVSATAIRVPTHACHGESVNVECEKPFEISEVRAALEAQPGIILQDDPSRKLYPMGAPGESSPVEGAAGRDAVYVGRIRKDHSVIQGSHGLHLWVVSDNLRKGAALNAIQIGEILVQHWF